MEKEMKEKLLNQISDIEESISDLRTELINITDNVKILLKNVNKLADEIEDLEVLEAAEEAKD